MYVEYILARGVSHNRMLPHDIQAIVGNNDDSLKAKMASLASVF